MPQVQELLEELQHLWAAQGCTIADDLAPGSSAQELDAAEADLEFALSEEVRDWYGWRNALVWPVPAGTRLPKWPSDRFPGHLAGAIRNYRTSREVAAELNHQDPRFPLHYGAAWLALTRPGPEVLIADNQLAAADPQAPSGLHEVAFEEPRKWHTVVMPSVASLLQAWLDLTRQGALRFDPTTDQWMWKIDEIPAHLRIPDTVFPAVLLARRADQP